MPTLDDERFKAYLKQFHPLIPDALPSNKRAPALPSYRVFAIWSAGVATAIILGVIGFRMIPNRVSAPSSPESVSVHAPMEPLTMRDANSMLATAPSYQAALEEMAFHRHRSTVPKDKQSAVEVLAKEKIKL